MPKPKEAEVESNTGMQTYYNITFVIFGMLSLYCFNFYTTYEKINCLIDNSELDPPKRRFLDTRPLYMQQLEDDYFELDEEDGHPNFMSNPVGSVRASYRRHM